MPAPAAEAAGAGIAANIVAQINDGNLINYFVGGDVPANATGCTVTGQVPGDCTGSVVVGLTGISTRKRSV